MAGHSNQERWLLTYSDLITLLMVFFIVMYSISEADKGKFIQLRSSMQKAFNNTSVGDSPDPKLLEGSGAAIAIEIPQPAAQVTTGDQKGSGDTADAQASADSVDSDDPRLGELRQSILPLAESQGVSNDVTVYRSPEGVVISLSGDVLFDSGKAELQPAGASFIRALAAVVKTWPEHLRVEGYTDNVAIDSQLYPSNWELSAERAVVTTRYLVEVCGIAPERVYAAAYGEFRPVADNSTREGRLRNRRVDVLILDTNLDTSLGNVLGEGQGP